MEREERNLSKKCTRCQLLKPLLEFGADSRCRHGKAARCKKCIRTAAVAYYAQHPELTEIRKKYAAEYSKVWYRNNKAVQLTRMKWTRMLRLYGITEDDYLRLLSLQAGSCKICGSNDPGRKDAYFAVDHDHDTGSIRGLLCHLCNCGIGMFRERLDLILKAAEYVKSSSINNMENKHERQ